MVNSRTKGASFEREIVKLFNEFLDKYDQPHIKRNLEQYQEKDLCDLHFFDFCVECKRYGEYPDNWYKQGWWDQVCRAAQKNNKYPLLVFKYNRRPIRVALPLRFLSDTYDDDMNKVFVTTIEDFLDTLDVFIAKGKYRI
tara:strand:+ start:1059 stop:1478 length:420 start_codon:yes stop_codon:yes gene_type:complete